MQKLLTHIVLISLIIISSCNKEEINGLEKRNEELLSQTTKLQQQVNQLTTEMSTLTLDVSNLLSSNDQLSSSNTDLSNQIIVLQNKINELEVDLNNLTTDYDEAITDNDELYDEYLSLQSSKTELQVQLDNLVSEINSVSCPPIEYSNSDMATEQLFCTNGYITPIEYVFDESIYSFSFIQDSIPSGINIIKSDGLVKVVGGPVSRIVDLYSFDLKFTSDQCEIIKRVVIARSPESPTIELISGPLTQSLEAEAQIQSIKFSFGGSSEGLSFSDLPEGLTYSIDANVYTISGSISVAGSHSFEVSTINQGGCDIITDTISFEVEEAAIPINTGGGGGTSGGGTSGGGTSGGGTSGGGTTTTTQYQLTVNAGANGSISSTGGSYDDGTSVSIIASPNTGYSFENWTDSSGNEIGTNATYTFNISSDTTITANYLVALFYLDPNGVTIRCPLAAVGASGTVNGVQYEKVDKAGLQALRNAATGGNNNQLAFVCTSGVDNLKDMFRKKGVFNIDISSWDTSSVTTMHRMFANAHAFNQDISKWDVSNVESMYNFLNLAYDFNQDISGWDVSNVTVMRRMFRDARAFNQDISGWDVGNVTDMRGFVSKTRVFNQDLTGWNVDNVTQCGDFSTDSLAMEDSNRPNFTNCDPSPSIVDSNPIPN